MVEIGRVDPGDLATAFRPGGEPAARILESRLGSQRLDRDAQSPRPSVNRKISATFPAPLALSVAASAAMLGLLDATTVHAQTLSRTWAGLPPAR